jgi:hypothetical protein
VRDLLGEKTASSYGFPADVIGESGYLTAAPLEGQGHDALVRATGVVATRVGGRLASLLPCAPASKGEEVCVGELLRGFVRHAFRRPLETREMTSLLDLFGELRRKHELDYRGAVEHLVQAALLSPQFLYLGDDGPGSQATRTLVKRGPYDVAAHLSYFLWSSLPDPALLAAAEGGRLGTPEQRRMEARRLLADPRAHEALAALFSEWWRLDLLASRDKSPKLFPEYDDVLRSDMARETTAFTRYVMTAGDGLLSTLLTAQFSFVNSKLAKLYALPDISGSELRKVDLPAGQRAGLLTHPSLMAIGSDLTLTSPVRRGVPLRERLLCDELAPPPGDVPPPPRDANKSSREQFTAHTTAPACASCHKVIDPLGWAFERYDPIGRYRTVDAGKPVDATGTFLSLKEGREQAFDGALALAGILAASPEVRACVTRQFFRFAHRRHERPTDAKALMEIEAGARGDLREVLLGIVAHPSFVEIPITTEAP